MGGRVGPAQHGGPGRRRHPHFDNAEGGTHDTRFCYLGEKRLRILEEQLPEEAWVLGVDEHTVSIFDFEAGTVTVAGLGTVTVRRQGRSVVLVSGTSLTIRDLVGLAVGLGPSLGFLAGHGPATGDGHLSGASHLSGDGLGTGAGPGPGSGALAGAGQGGGGAESDLSPAGVTNGVAGSGAGYAAALLAVPGGAGGPGGDVSRSLTDEVARLTVAFDGAVDHRDAQAATAAVLQLEKALHDWSADTTQSDEVDRARAALRRMVLRLGELAGPGLRDPATVARPWVEALLTERTEARQSRRFADADRIRGTLVGLGVEVRDTPTGTDWDLWRLGAVEP